MRTINFIGAGKLGKTLAKLILKHNIGKIQGIKNSSFLSGVKAVKFIGQGQAYKEIKDLPMADITFITTPDAVIQQCCEELCRSAKLNLKSTIVHCSGALSSEVLQQAKTLGCCIASIHPMQSFANVKISIGQFKGTYCAIEGDPLAISILSNIFSDMGANIFEIVKSKKALYHTAGIFASNYLIVLCDIAITCLKDAGVEPTIAKEIISSLMKNTVNNLQIKSAKNALTGPIKRGDSDIVSNHLEALTDFNLRNIYQTLGLATLALANLPKDKEDELKKILTD